MSKENYQWLEKELPSWVKEGIVNQEGAKALLVRYQGEKKLGGASGMAFSLLGFAMVGLASSLFWRITGISWGIWSELF